MQDENGNGPASRSVDVTVSAGRKGYDFTFDGDGFDARGNVTVTGPRQRPVRLKFTLVPGEGVERVEFPRDAARAVRIGSTPDCPPNDDSPQFDEKVTGPAIPGGKNDVLSFRDKMTEAGDFAYALTVEVTRTGGKPEQVTHDPLVANRPN